MTCCRRQCWGPPGCDDERRAPAVKSGVPLLPMSAAKRFCSALSFRRRVLQTSPPAAPRSPTSPAAQTDASGHGVRRQRRTLCSQRRPLTEAVAGPTDFGARRAGCGCQVEVFMGPIFSPNSSPPHEPGSKSIPPQIQNLMGQPPQSISK